MEKIKHMWMVLLIFTRLLIFAKLFIPHQNLLLIYYPKVSNIDFTNPDDARAMQELYLLRHTPKTIKVIFSKIQKRFVNCLSKFSDNHPC